MRYFSDAKISEMRESVKNELSEQERSLCMAYITQIEILDKRNDEFGDCREELMQAIAGLEKVTEGYVHRGRSE